MGTVFELPIVVIVRPSSAAAINVMILPEWHLIKLYAVFSSLTYFKPMRVTIHSFK